MNKNKLYLGVISALLASPVLANNAILNVEGEIQINGKTVIDSSGSYVGSQSSTSNLKSINLDDYYAPNGTYVYKVLETHSYDGYEDEYSRTCTDTVVLTSTSESSERVCDDLIHPEKWSYTDNSDGTYTVVYESVVASNACTSVEECVVEEEHVRTEQTYKYEQFSDNVSVIALGSSFATMFEETLLTSNEEYDQNRINKPYLGTSRTNFSAFLSSFSTTENSYSNCYLNLDDRGDEMFSVNCPNLGQVQFTYNDNGYYKYSRELVSYEATDSKTAKVSRSQQPRHLLNIIAEHDKKQAQKKFN